MGRKPRRSEGWEKVLVRLRPPLHRKLVQRARTEDRPQAQIMRDALRAYLEARPA